MATTIRAESDLRDTSLRTGKRVHAIALEVAAGDVKGGRGGNIAKTTTHTPRNTTRYNLLEKT